MYCFKVSLFEGIERVAQYQSTGKSNLGVLREYLISYMFFYTFKESFSIFLEVVRDFPE